MNLADIDVTGYDTLLLDRDGVINRLRPGDYVKCWEEFEFLPGILEAMKKWAGHFRHIFIVTNQRGVGKGLMSEDSLKAIHDKMISVVNGHGGRIDRIYCCTALTREDVRRKPGIGMFLDILKDYPDVKRENCIMIGDSEGDMEFAKNCGIAGIRYVEDIPTKAINRGQL